MLDVCVEGEWWIVNVRVKGDGVRWMCVEGG